MESINYIGIKKHYWVARFIVLSVFVGVTSSVAIGQPGKAIPKIGTVCPEFVLHDVSNLEQETASRDFFKGKWLILYFWSRNCLSCVQSFPKIHKFQQEFRGAIQFVLVASSAKDNKDFYKKLASRYDLTIASAYDSILFTKFAVETVPHVIIIDPKSVVRAITTFEDINAENLANLLNGGRPFFRVKTDNGWDNTTGVQYWKSIGQEADILHNSVLSRWNHSQPISITTKIDRNIEEAYFQTMTTSLSNLYEIAYIGEINWDFENANYLQFWDDPIIVSSDSVFFKTNLNESLGYYNYYISVPKSKATKKYLQWAMQCDLKKYFGFDVVIESRMMPCWKLVVKNGRKSSNLKSKGTVPIIEMDLTGLTLTNYPVSMLLKTIWIYNEKEGIFVDSTGITGNIDIELDAILTDLEDVKKSLNEKGLDLVAGQHEMCVMVIK